MRLRLRRPHAPRRRALDALPVDTDSLPSPAGAGRFSFAFIDHDHGLAASAHAVADVPALLPPGGVALFHDLNDEANRPSGDYGVLRAVRGAVEDGRLRTVALVGSALLVQTP